MTFVLISKYTPGKDPIPAYEAINQALNLSLDDWALGTSPHEVAMLEIALQEADPKAFRAEDRGGVWVVILNSSNDS